MKTKRPLIIAFLLIGIIFCQPAFSQFYSVIFQNDADSIRGLLKGASQSELPNLYNQLAFHYSLDQPDSCFYYAGKALEMAEEDNNRYEEAAAYRHMGNAFNRQGDYRQAVRNIQKSMEIFKDLDDKRALMEAIFDMSRINYDANLYDRMLVPKDELMQLLKDDEKGENSVITPLEHTLMLGFAAISNREAGTYDKGIEIFRDYMEHARQLNYKVPGHEHFVKSAAEMFNYAGQYDSALKYTLLARYYLPENLGKIENEFTGFETSLGELYFALGDYQEAITYLRKGLNSRKESLRYASLYRCSLGDAYMKIGEYDSAYFNYHLALGLAKEFRASPVFSDTSAASMDVYTGYQYFFNINNLELRDIYYKLMAHIHRSFYNYFLQEQNYKEALLHHEQLMVYRDSVNYARNNMEIRRMQVQFATDQIEKENELLQSENELKESRISQNRLVLSAVSAIALLVIVAGIGLFRQSRMRSLQEKILLEQRLLRTQMNPHFIFNSLGSIQSSIINEEPERAVKYLSRFSKLMRSILEQSTLETIPLEEEINTIRNYLELQQARYDHKFDFSIEVGENIDTEMVQVPPMLAQPFIENAIEHGMKYKEGKGKIEVRIGRLGDVTVGRLGDVVIFEVEDDGVGRQAAQDILRKQDKDHKSLATVITRERIAALNRRSKRKITLAILDLSDDVGQAAGTLVRFAIPVR